MNLLSIVIPYYNRKSILVNTLRSLEYYRGDQEIEVIIVDDGSAPNQKINDLPAHYSTLNIKTIILRGDNSRWRAPATAYNAGFNIAQGDVVMLNSSDCIHAGGVIKYTAENLTPKDYFCFSTLAVSTTVNNYFDNVRWDENTILKAKEMYDFKNGWWRCHSKLNRIFLPWCATIYRTALEKLSGYDERFTNGIGYDDCDFIDRVTNLGLNMVLIDEPFCIHQYHELVQYTNSVNKDFLSHLVATEPNRVKAPQNKIYVR